MVGSSGSRVFLAFVLAFYTALFLFTFHEADEDVWGRMAVGRLVHRGLASAEFPYEDDRRSKSLTWPKVVRYHSLTLESRHR